MDFITPPMYDVTNIDIWKVKMSMYLKTLRMHVYLVTTKKSYLDNFKHICHAPLPKIRGNGVATRVGDVYTRGKYPTYTR